MLTLTKLPREWSLRALTPGDLEPFGPHVARRVTAHRSPRLQAREPAVTGRVDPHELAAPGRDGHDRGRPLPPQELEADRLQPLPARPGSTAACGRIRIT